MSLIIGDTVSKRKRCLAELVKEHLIALGHEAELVENRTNSAGHTDQVIVDSSIGIIHVSASSSLEPNASIRAGDYQEGCQDFLVDKKYIAFGWNTKDKRTIIMFVHAKEIEGKSSLTKNEIKQLSERILNKVLSPA
ncbi:hypothetical protein [Stutzerimonas nitrititolerans]|uniref:hypothetical protein n=1 Tax=Stutzerimonas nitrititolerans TaxID=2482751 RepID=UPI0028A8AA5B|nr:hypothetical protein [Stutzerimonas nitrititolerans]